MREPPTAPAGYTEWRKAIEAVAVDGFDRLSESFKQSTVETRNHVLAHEREWWTNLKAKAKGVAK